MMPARQSESTRPFSVAPPMMGVVNDAPLYSGEAQPTAAIWMYNMIPDEFGCRVRPGSAVHANKLLDSNGVTGEVRTIMEYHTPTGSTKLFAATDAGIYNITTAGDAGAIEYNWDNPGGDAGWCSWINHTGVDGAHHLLVCDEANGYIIYDGTGWRRGTFSGFPIADGSTFVHVMEWQGRLWFANRGDSAAYFLDPLAIEGKVTAFDVGNRFSKGGYLAVNASWTLDDGVGLNDRLVQISSAGDVLVWDGTNPEDATTMTLAGRWNVGALPTGRRMASHWGGDLLLLTEFGVVSLKDLVAGEHFDRSRYLTNPVRVQYRTAYQQAFGREGWSLHLVPAEGLLIATVPPSDSLKYPIQFVWAFTNNAWTTFRDLDMLCMANTTSGVFFGTRDGRVMSLLGSADDVPLDPATGGQKSIRYGFQTHFSDMGAPSMWKRPQFVRPAWMATQAPAIAVQVKTDYDTIENAVVPPLTVLDPSRWDSAAWDEDVWRGARVAIQPTYGVTGQGRSLSLTIVGETQAEVVYLGAEILADAGGQM